MSDSPPATINGERNLEYHRWYYHQNKEAIKQYNEQYRDQNKDKLTEAKKRYRENNREKIKAREKLYYEANKDKINKRRRERRRINGQSRSGRARTAEENRRAYAREQKRLKNDADFRHRRGNQKAVMYNKPTLNPCYNSTYDIRFSPTVDDISDALADMGTFL
jgi:hypothetical protein